MRAEVFPLEKIKLDDKEILLGMKADKVRSCLGNQTVFFRIMGEIPIGIFILIVN